MRVKAGQPPGRKRIGWKTTVKLLLALWAASAVYALLLQFAGGLSAMELARGLPALLRTWALQLWLPWVPLAPLALYLCSRLAWPRSAGRRFLLAHLGGFALVAALHALILAVSRAPVSSLLENGYLLIDALVYALLAAGSNLRRLSESLGRKELDAARLNKNLSESRLQTLKMQLNPHFLFNTLNSVSVLVEKNDNEQAQEMIGELSRFLRQTLRNSEEKWISLNRELNLVREYLAIEKIRFGNRLVYHEECEPLALSAKVPPMLLQPLFENAIVHGLAEKQGPCRLSFECRVHDRRLFILISDNGEGFDSARDPRHRAGIGLANIHARLKEVYGENYSMGLEKIAAGGTQVSLKIPAYKDSYF